jgi:hypothetical protein
VLSCEETRVKNQPIRRSQKNKRVFKESGKDTEKKEGKEEEEEEEEYLLLFGRRGLQKGTFEVVMPCRMTEENSKSSTIKKEVGGCTDGWRYERERNTNECFLFFFFYANFANPSW